MEQGRWRFRWWWGLRMEEGWWMVGRWSTLSMQQAHVDGSAAVDASEVEDGAGGWVARRVSGQGGGF